MAPESESDAILSQAAGNCQVWSMCWYALVIVCDYQGLTYTLRFDQIKTHQSGLSRICQIQIDSTEIRLTLSIDLRKFK